MQLRKRQARTSVELTEDLGMIRATKVTKTVTDTFRVRRSAARGISKVTVNHLELSTAQVHSDATAKALEGGAHSQTPTQSAQKAINGSAADEAHDSTAKHVRKRRGKAASAPTPTLAAEEVLPPLCEESMAAGLAHLRITEPRLCGLIDAHGPPVSLLPKNRSSYASLTRSIVYQQLATKAASAIFARFLTACKCESEISPELVMATSFEDLRACGLSGNKAKYVLDLARHYSEGLLTDQTIAAMSEEELMQQLTVVKGIGPWSVHMFAMFHAGRPDVLPVGDLGVRKGFQALYGLKDLPDAKRMEGLSEAWRPWRSLGCWYMWRLAEAEAARTKKAGPSSAKKRVAAP